MNPEQMISVRIGDCVNVMREIPDCSVHCCVTSPPYWGLRDYGNPGQIGLESTQEAYVEKLVSVFREVRRALRDDGTLWLNLGDTYSNKSALGIPWQVAFALVADGWKLRQDIIWHKPNAMPESVEDRCTRAHEYIFLLTKSDQYHYDADAIKERAVSDHDSGNGFAGRQGGAAHLPMSGGIGTKEQWRSGRTGRNAFRGQGHFRECESGKTNRDGRDMSDVDANFDGTRNKRSVWSVPVKPYHGAHFATYPADLIKPCILAGCPKGGTVLDPFAGSGTTGQVAAELSRKAILIELNPDYSGLIRDRISNITPGLPL